MVCQSKFKIRVVDFKKILHVNVTLRGQKLQGWKLEETDPQIRRLRTMKYNFIISEVEFEERMKTPFGI